MWVPHRWEGRWDVRCFFSRDDVRCWDRSGGDRIVVSDRIVPGKDHIVPGKDHIVAGKNHIVPGTNHIVVGKHRIAEAGGNALKRSAR